MDYEIILTDEYERKKALRIEVERKIATLPRGNIQPKNIKGILYYYLQFRDGNKVKTKYVPKKELKDVKQKIKKRKELEAQLKLMIIEEEKMARHIGKHVTYKPIKNIDNNEYARFMSSVAHDYKRMNRDDFFEKYKPSNYRGLQKKYVKGYIDWLNGSYERNIRKGNDIVLDPYTYYMYFEVGEKNVLLQELELAIPEFLNQGLLITNVQGAVCGA